MEKSCKEFPEGVPTPSGDFHAMDCQDIIIGKAKGDQINIDDYYTRDRYDYHFIVRLDFKIHFTLNLGPHQEEMPSMEVNLI